METAHENSTNIPILIDGDLLVWIEATAIECIVHWESDVHTLVCDFSELKQRLDVRIISYVERFDASEYTVCFSDGKHNFRNDFAPEYKANRKLVRKPISFRAAVEYCHEVWRGVTWKNLEADDVLGILGTRYPKSVVISSDKDTATVPCNWWNPRLDTDDVRVITPAQAEYNHLLQTLTGDRTDNYTGIPGCGPRSAEKILNAGVDWGTVVLAYEKAGLSEDDALLNARCARICRDGDYIAAKGVVRAWEPGR